MGRIGSNLLKQSKASYEEDKHSKSSGNKKDVLSLLVQANANEDLPASQRMTDEDVLARAYKLVLRPIYLLNIVTEIPAFLIAGHETTRYRRLFLAYSVI